jgi:hypothetical protein
MKEEIDRVVFFFPDIQECHIYLIGTKLDLVQNDPSARRIDFSVAKSYADGLCCFLGTYKIFRLIFAFNFDRY